MEGLGFILGDQKEWYTQLDKPERSPLGGQVQTINGTQEKLKGTENLERERHGSELLLILERL